jgi:hypothetical protein
MREPSGEKHATSVRSIRGPEAGGQGEGAAGGRHQQWRRHPLFRARE